MSNLTIQRGQSVRWRITLNQADDTPMDLTGASWEVLESTLGDGLTITGTVTDAANGISEISIGKDQTVNLKTGNKRLRLRVALVGGDAIALPQLAVQVK